MLGHFLNDPEGRDGKDLLGYLREGGDCVPFPPNCEASYGVVSKLNIADPPVEGIVRIQNSYIPDSLKIDAWKAWWNEVKDGRRTFRFIGSSIEYGADGPVSKNKAQQSETDRKGDAVGTARETNSWKLSSIAGIIAACCLCVAAVWYYLRAAGRKSS